MLKKTNPHPKASYYTQQMKRPFKSNPKIFTGMTIYSGLIQSPTSMKYRNFISPILYDPF